MIGPRDTNVVQIPIDQVVVVNPRSRGKHKFRQIVTNISHLGLKKPITVVQRGTREDKPLYELVCGQGRLEACKQLGDTTVPALIIDATREDLMLMSLAENLARRRQTCVELLREIATLKDRGHSFQEIADKTDLHPSYVKGIIRLLKQGEHRLLRAVEKGQIPISVAVIRMKRDLLNGICPEAVTLLKDRRITAAAIRELRRVSPMRQIEMAELMIAANNFSTGYAKCLVAGTADKDLVGADKSKMLPGMKPEDLARMEREMEVLGREFRLVEESYGQNTLNLVLAVAYLRRLLDNAGVAKYLAQHHGGVLTEFQKLVASPDLRPGD